MALTKNGIANKLYGYDYDDCYPGEKAAVTKAYNKQTTSSPVRKSRKATSNFLQVQVGRIGDNGVSTCMVAPGTTVSELLDQANFDLDEDKEGINAKSTGNTVGLDEEVKNGETYFITAEIKSA